ncbi:MAG: tripartite tricarboxylate transporter substrate binding protein [Betaproteobacteria bacterium]|nr:MAG: tripartite tricarboxylate transporter substrate binding protein [Betaproteobacteria bacterium]
MLSSRPTSSPGCPGRRRRCWRARTGCGRRRGSQRGEEWWPWRFRLMRGGSGMIKTFAALAALALSAWLQGAAAQDYPAREIRAICNYAAGSGADLIVRFYSDQLSRLAGKPVIVENKPGAQGMVANEFVAKSRPDGLTILITPVSSTVNLARSLFRQLSYDPQKDFAAVTTLATVSFTLAVDAKKPIHSIQELVAHLKAQPRQGFYGATSNAGVISGELFKSMAGLDTTYVPYKANPNALADLLAGQLDFIAFDSTWTLAQQRNGFVRILAVTTARRSGALPEVPTMQEAGFKDYDMTPWWGVLAPAGTPRPVIDKLAGWFNQITNSEEGRQFLARSAFDPFPGTPESAARLLNADFERWARYAKMAKIEPQ